MLGAFWVPVMWRSTAAGLARVAGEIQHAGLAVQSTLVLYESLSGPERARLIHDPALEWLHPDAKRLWRGLSPSEPPGYGFHRFTKRVVGALDRAGVPLLAGTDAMGLPLIVPGISLHRELALLTDSGLTNYEALRAATVAPAAFLNRTHEFGMVAVGQRADLLLVDGNPLEDLGHLARPLGVAARGHWFSREQLDRMLDSLRSSD
jgi:hypothetical protein